MRHNYVIKSSDFLFLSMFMKKRERQGKKNTPNRELKKQEAKLEGMSSQKPGVVMVQKVAKNQF